MVGRFLALVAAVVVDGDIVGISLSLGGGS